MSEEGEKEGWHYVVLKDASKTQSAVGSPEEYPCLERRRARCKAENVMRLSRSLSDIIGSSNLAPQKEKSIYELAQQL